MIVLVGQSLKLDILSEFDICFVEKCISGEHPVSCATFPVPYPRICVLVCFVVFHRDVGGCMVCPYVKSEGSAAIGDAIVRDLDIVGRTSFFI